MSNDEIDFLDGLDDVSARPKPVAPAAVVAPVVAPPQNHETLKFIAILAACAVCSLGSGLLFAWLLSGRPDGPTPTVNSVELGRKFAPILAGTLADGFDEGETQLRAGKTLGDADIALKAKFDAARKAAFDAHAGGAIHGISPDGKDLDPAQREAMIALFHGFSKGLRGGK